MATNEKMQLAAAADEAVALLSVKNLSISFRQEGVSFQAVKNISFNLAPGRFTAIVGESGSGKSVTALSMLQLLPSQAAVTGSLLFNRPGGNLLDITQAGKEAIQQVRGNEIAMIFQEPMTSLNPVLTCGNQVMESLILHKKISRRQAKAATIVLFEQVELPAPDQMLNRYPHQLSGGQKQRVMIAMAMSCNPALLVADEPTTALDVRVQKNILDLLKKLQQQQQMAILFITHDLGLVAAYAENVLVMRQGEIVEQGLTAQVLANPKHAYTKALLACRPTKNSKGKKLPVVSDFLDENPTLVATPATTNNTNFSTPDQSPILRVENLKVYFPGTKNFFGKTVSHFKAVDDVSFSINRNEIVGLVGESGCGKTTLGRTILQLIAPTSGRILLHGKEIQLQSRQALRKIRKDLQIVFQDPYGSLNPRISIGDAILEPMGVHGMHENKKQRKEKVHQLLEQVNMLPDHFNRYPHQFSGGQRQRICIARALALEPSFIIFDESVSALDVSVQAQVLNLIQDLKNSFQFTSIFISHDLSVVHYISDRVMVMHKGKIVETGSADQVMFKPREDYTKMLIEAIPG